MAPSPAKMTAAIYREDLLAFIHRSFLELNPADNFEYNWHLELIAQKLEDVAYGRCKRLIINVPPRHLKSHSASIAFPAWFLGHFPHQQVACVSYGQDFADKLARHSRRLMQSDFYQALFKTRVSSKRDTVADFETTQGGFRFSTSVGGPFTGRGANVIVIDDPLKADEALSDPRRESVNAWFDNTLRSRLNRQAEGAIIIIMQRLHADDLVAHVQSTERWDVLSFPAIAEKKATFKSRTPYENRIFHRKEGDILQPALTPPHVLENIRRTMTEYIFAAQYQQNPQPSVGNIVKRKWLHFYTPKERPDRFDITLQSWDTAVKDTQRSDFSVCTTWGVKGKKAYLLHVFRRKLEFPDLKREVHRLAKFHEATVVLVEDKSSGSSLIQQLRAEDLAIVLPAPAIEGDKQMRLNAQTAVIEGGFALFPKKAEWLDIYLSELISFPSVSYDDQVDSTVYALAWIANNPIYSGTIIKPSWFHYYTELPQNQQGKRVFMSWDTPRKDDAQRTWTVCTIWMLLDQTYYLLHMERGLYGYVELQQRIDELYKEHQFFKILMEQTTTGVAMEKDHGLAQHHLIKLYEVEDDRSGRVSVLERMFTDGLVRFPKNKPFMAELETELRGYPYGQSDDIVDSIALALTVGGSGYDSSLSWV
ncbi:phage terminase large subunit [Pseudorhodoplanes sp.]|uniref:phage terminase large subunit n=1 Tax=Pseudorhodoplanes sp. TaxID=1934341 RepID=UPI003D11A405